MPWDIWMLIAILVLCLTVIGWSFWGFHSENRSEDSDPLLLAMTTGEYLYIRGASGCSGRHRAGHHDVSAIGLVAQIMSFAVSQRMMGQPQKTGSQQVRTR